METKFTLRKPTWKGLGINVAEARSSEEALAMSGLDWHVYQQTMTADNGIPIMGYKANIRDVDDQLLGVVTDKYQVVQNEEAFAFTDELLGRGVRYETAGMLQDGRKTWILGNFRWYYSKCNKFGRWKKIKSRGDKSRSNDFSGCTCTSANYICVNVQSKCCRKQECYSNSRRTINNY